MSETSNSLKTPNLSAGHSTIAQNQLCSACKPTSAVAQKGKLSVYVLPGRDWLKHTFRTCEKWVICLKKFIYKRKIRHSKNQTTVKYHYFPETGYSS